MNEMWTRGWYDGYYRRKRRDTNDAYLDGYRRGMSDADLENAAKVDPCPTCGIPMCEHLLVHRVRCARDWAWAGR